MAFTKLFWTNKGNHQEITAQKFLPDVSFEDLKSRRPRREAQRLVPHTCSEPDLIKELDALRPSLFDPNFEPLITAKSPKGDLDILQASANNFYSGVKLADLKNFKERYSLELPRHAKARRLAGRRGVSRRHARRQSSAGPLRAVSAQKPSTLSRKPSPTPSPARKKFCAT